MSINQFYLPSVYDNLFDFVIREPSHHFNLLQLIHSSANIGHPFTDFDSLSPLITKTYFSYIDKKCFTSALSLLWSLTLMQCFPEHLLLHLFSLSTLQDIDSYITGFICCHFKIF